MFTVESLLKRMKAHRVHHIYWSYGWKVPLIRLGYFPSTSFGKRHGFKWMKGRGKDYHDCTATGIH